MDQSPHHWVRIFLGTLLLSSVGIRAEVGALRLEVHGDRVSLDADEVPLRAILDELDRQIQGDLSFGELDDRTVTLHHDDIAIDRLLSGLSINYALIYTVNPETSAITLNGGWGVSYRGGQPVRNSLVVPLDLEDMITQAMRPYEEQVTNGLPTVYPVIYPASATIDGDFSDWPSNLPWHVVGGDVGSYQARPGKTDPADYPAYPPQDDVDCSYTWGAMMDDENLYVAVRVVDDYKIAHETPDDNLIFLDDSVEFYIDGGNEKNTSYDKNDAQIAIARGEDWDNPATPRISPWSGYGSGIPGDQTKTEVVIQNTEDGYLAEAKIPLKTFGIDPITQDAIGFNIHVNDDDNGGLRDHKLMWSSIEQTDGEQSYHNPSVFGTMTLLDITPATEVP
ncbi:MAG: hypothetical protein KDL31_12095 [Kiritimatiellae bacterium]|nr:hypothetical protein [Kiritimatiellia bacterium]MCB1101010.1 hypothetical protein [Kiritimatiellia bacterium]